MDYSLALHTLVRCNDTSTRTEFLRELRVIRVHSESMAKVNIISGNEAAEAEEAEQWLRYQNKEAPWDMHGVTAATPRTPMTVIQRCSTPPPPTPSTMAPVWRIW